MSKLLSEIGGHLTYFSLSLKGIKVVRLPHRGYILGLRTKNSHTLMAK
jgi:hypothetical protein